MDIRCRLRPDDRAADVGYRHAAAHQGQRFYDTTLSVELIYDGSSWRDAAGVAH
jgi:hypothetical protein